MNLAAIDRERLLGAFKTVLAERGLATPTEITERIAATDAATPAIGARLVAKAWVDPDFRDFLVRDATAAAESQGVTLRGSAPLGALENTATLHHLVVCTLCSCYPRAVLGYPPFWYKSVAYRARAIRDPRGVLAEWGTILAPDVAIRVLDSTADYRWMVIPRRPAGTEDWTQERLAILIGAPDMMGVTVPRA